MIVDYSLPSIHAPAARALLDRLERTLDGVFRPLNGADKEVAGHLVAAGALEQHGDGYRLGAGYREVSL